MFDQSNKEHFDNALNAIVSYIKPRHYAFRMYMRRLLNHLSCLPHLPKRSKMGQIFSRGATAKSKAQPVSIHQSVYASIHAANQSRTSPRSPVTSPTTPFVSIHDPIYAFIYNADDDDTCTFPGDDEVNWATPKRNNNDPAFDPRDTSAHALSAVGRYSTPAERPVNAGDKMYNYRTQRYDLQPRRDGFPGDPRCS